MATVISQVTFDKDIGRLENEGDKQTYVEKMYDTCFERIGSLIYDSINDRHGKINGVFMDKGHVWIGSSYNL